MPESGKELPNIIIAATPALVREWYKLEGMAVGLEGWLGSTVRDQIDLVRDYLDGCTIEQGIEYRITQLPWDGCLSD